jgi:hypothetical protein
MALSGPHFTSAVMSDNRGQRGHSEVKSTRLKLDRAVKLATSKLAAEITDLKVKIAELRVEIATEKVERKQAAVGGDIPLLPLRGAGTSLN